VYNRVAQEASNRDILPQWKQWLQRLDLAPVLLTAVACTLQH
jgi:hypothetical protein